MKILSICTGWLVQEQFIADHAVADKAYADLRAAMATYQEYGNDKDKTVTIETGDSGSMTVRLAHLVSVSCDDTALSEPSIIARAVWQRAIKAKIEAACAPAS